MIEMTAKQEAILSHKVPDAKAWYAHAVKEFGPQLAYEHMAAKCKRYEQEYDIESKRQDYKTRKQRDEAEKAKDR